VSAHETKPFAFVRSVSRHRFVDADRPSSPEYDVTTIRHAVVDADPETTYEAMLTADLLDTGPIVRALGALRNAPMVIVRRIRGIPDRHRPNGCGSSMFRRPTSDAAPTKRMGRSSSSVRSGSSGDRRSSGDRCLRRVLGVRRVGVRETRGSACPSDRTARTGRCCPTRRALRRPTTPPAGTSAGTGASSARSRAT